MASLIKHAAMAALLTCVSAVEAGANSEFCTPGANGGKSTLNFQIKPSMVVHDETMDVTFGDAALANPGGQDSERLFSFARTIGAILQSAGATNDAQSREALVGTLIKSFDNDEKLLLNPASAVLVPVDDRLTINSDGVAEGEGTLIAGQLLDEANTSFGMKPLALFNRFDLAPADWEHCGEYRIIYSIPNGGFEKRFFLIFEAMVPNPGFVAGDLARSEAGCRPMAEFWAGLGGSSGGTAIERAKKLQELYYTGIAGITVSTDPAAQTKGLNPIVSFRNYGGEGGRGQVRGNVFFGGGWQLREWLTQLTIEGVSFVPEVVKGNPIAELYLDDLSATAIGQRNIKSSIDGLHRDFIESFGTVVQKNLLVERSPKFQERVDGLKDYDVGSLDEDDLLVTLFALGSSDRFDEFQSHSNPDENADEPSKNAGPLFQNMLKFLLMRPELVSGRLPPQTVEVLLNRAEAGTCAGCHQTAAREGVDFVPSVVKIKADGSTVLWPDVVAGGPGFVHVDEGRRLSVALEDHFLPVRRYLMGISLCKTLPAPPAAAVPVAAMQSAIDKVIGDLAKENFVTMMSAKETPLETLSILPPPVQEQAVEQIIEKTRIERELEQLKPGAFIEQRRPH